jgi:hypothetical protein
MASKAKSSKSKSGATKPATKSSKTSFFEQHKTALLLGGGALALGAAAYILTKGATDPLTDSPPTMNNNNVIAPGPQPAKKKSAYTTLKDAAKTVAEKTGLVRIWKAASYPLAPGMKGDAVGALQVALKAQGAQLTADGMFGGDTEKALAQLGYTVPVSLAAYNTIRLKGKASTPQSGETKYQQLVRLGYSAASEIQPAQKLRDYITSPLATSSDLIEAIFKGAIKNQTNILRAYRLLFGSNAVEDLNKLSFAPIRLNSLLNRLQSLEGIELVEGLGCSGTSCNCGTKGLDGAPQGRMIYATGAVSITDNATGRTYKTNTGEYLGQMVATLGGCVYVTLRGKGFSIATTEPIETRSDAKMVARDSRFRLPTVM